MKIGNVELKNNYILAPMAGVSDLPFRVLCAENGAGLVCMEMISAKALYYRNKNTIELTRISPEEHPVSMQLFGHEPEIITAIADRLAEIPFDILDINMGCPMPKIVNNGEGSALMRDPVLAGKMVEAAVRAVDRPVTVKIRKGFDDEHVNAAEVAHAAEESGASAVTVHGRTREQYYDGDADWSIIADVKNRVHIPVIGNGDVLSYESAAEMMKQSGCDGVAVGRAAKGDPWIFREFSEGRKYRPSEDEIKEVMKRHCCMELECKGEFTAVREMRKHISWYTAGLPHSARLREQINNVVTMESMLRLIDAL